MANQADYDKALLKLEAGLALTKEQQELMVKAAKQAGSFGNRVRAALNK